MKVLAKMSINVRCQQQQVSLNCSPINSVKVIKIAKSRITVVTNFFGIDVIMKLHLPIFTYPYISEDQSYFLEKTHAHNGINSEM